jgi:hypothetical protein
LAAEAPTGLLLEIEIPERLPGRVADDEVLRVHSAIDGNANGRFAPFRAGLSLRISGQPLT